MAGIRFSTMRKQLSRSAGGNTLAEIKSCKFCKPKLTFFSASRCYAREFERLLGSDEYGVGRKVFLMDGRDCKSFFLQIAGNLMPILVVAPLGQDNNSAFF